MQKSVLCPWKISCQRCAFRSWSLPLRAHNALLQRDQSKQREPGGGETSMLLARDHSGQAVLHWVADPSLVAAAPFEEQIMPREMRFDLTLWPAWLGARAGPGARALKPSNMMFNAPRPTRACHLSIIKPLSTTRSLLCPWPLREPRGSSSPKASYEGRSPCSP